MRVVITGGSGFVGLALAEAVLGAHGSGAAVLFADRAPSAPMLRALPGGGTEVVLGDVRDRAALAGCLAAAQPDVLVHAAAVTPGPARERDDPEGILSVNVVGAAAAVRAAAEAGVAQVLLVSSVAAYGEVPPGTGPTLPESYPPAPTSLYGIGKLAAEMAATRLAALFGLRLAAARLGPVFGPFEHETGVRDRMSPQLQMVRLAAAGRPVRLPHAFEADWLYSRDAASGLLALAEALVRATPAPDGVFNVGSGVPSSALDWARHLRGTFPRLDCAVADDPADANVEYGAARGRPPLDTARLREATGFAAAYGGERAASDYLDWLRLHDGGCVAAS